MATSATLRPPRRGPVTSSPHAEHRVKTHAVPSWTWKILMAVTGAIWAAFVLIHLWGNLKVWSGAVAFDNYAHWLRIFGYPLVPQEFVLWALRVTLAISLVIHVCGGLILWARGRHARGSVRPKVAVRLSRLMVLSGLVVLVFVVVHILDLTIGVEPVATGEFVTGSAYANLIASLSRPAMAIFYGVTMVLLGGHLAHGIQVAATDLGASTHRWRRIALIVAMLVALAIVIGNGLIPLAIQTGWLS